MRKADRPPQLFFQQVKKIILSLFVSLSFIYAWIPTLSAQSEPRFSANVIAHTLASWTDGHDCGRVCTDARREGAADNFDYVVSGEDIRDISRAIISATSLYDEVTAEIIIGVGWHESNMQRYAVGPGGECGIFQQIPRYIRPLDLRESLGGDYNVVCDWLQIAEQSVMAFANNAQRWIQRESDEWLCYYNQGHQGCNAEGIEYQHDTNRVISRAHHNLRHFRRLERAGELSTFLTIEQDACIETSQTLVHAAIEGGETNLEPIKVPSG